MPPSQSRVSTNEQPASARHTAMLTVTLLGCLALLAVRKPDAFTTPQFWAEDGAQFFDHAREEGLAGLLTPYNGYRHVLPRVIALATTALPPTIAPAVFNLSAVVIMLLAAAFCFDSRLGLRPSSAAAFALTFVLIPHSGVVFANLTNVLNVLVMPLVLLTLTATPRRRREYVLDLCLLVFAGSSGPWVAVVAPFFLLRVLRQRDRWSVILLVVAAVLALIQTIGLDGARTPGELDLSNPVWPAAIAARGVGALLCGWAGPLGVDLRIAEHAPAYAAMSVALHAFVIVGGLLAKRPHAAILGTASLAFQGLVAWAYRGNPFYLFTEGLDRYSYPALITLAWGLILLAERSGSKVTAWPARLLLIGVVASTLGGFTIEPQPDMRWREAWETSIESIPENIAITPPGWFVSRTPEAADSVAAVAALGETLGREITLVRPDDVVPVRVWTGKQWLTGLPAGAGCIFEVPLGVTEIDLELRTLGTPTRDDAWTTAVVALVDDPDAPEVVHAERLELGSRLGELGPESRTIELPPDRDVTRIGLGVNGGVGAGGWIFVWQIRATR